MPFIDDNDCGLGIAVKSYLDELATADSETVVTEALKTEVKRKGQEEWFPHSVDLASDLDKAFRLWDAVILLSFLYHGLWLTLMETDLPRRQGRRKRNQRRRKMDRDQ